MQETGKRQYAMKKAYEIGYAIFRVSGAMGNPSMKEHLERQALSLLDAVAVGNYTWANMVAKAIEYLIKFAGDIGIMNGRNAEVITAQLNEMNAAIAGLDKPATMEPAMVPMDDIFTDQEPLFKESRKHARSDIKADTSEVRQTAILERIRQSGNCRLKDIQEILPDLSERTLRYDLQYLVEQDMIERVGNGGPAVFYKVRQSAQSPQG